MPLPAPLPCHAITRCRGCSPSPLLSIASPRTRAGSGRPEERSTRSRRVECRPRKRAERGVFRGRKQRCATEAGLVLIERFLLRRVPSVTYKFGGKHLFGCRCPICDHRSWYHASNCRCPKCTVARGDKQKPR